MFVIDKCDIDSGFFGEEAVCGDSGQYVDNEVVERAMPGVLYLSDVLQLVVDGLYDGPLSQQDLVFRAHEHVPHVVAHACDELYAVDEQQLEKGPADISPISAEFALDVLQIAPVPQRLAVVGVARGNHEVEYLAAVVDDQVQLETVEPAHGGPALLRKAGESAVGVHALDVAYPQCRGVGEAYAGTLAQEHVLDEQAQADGHFLLQLYEAAVGDHSGKQMPHVTAHIAEIEVLEAAEPSGMEQDEYDHYLRITHAVRLVPVSPAVTASLPEGIFMFDFGKFLTVFVDHVENFNNFVLCDHSGKSLMFVF